VIKYGNEANVITGTLPTSSSGDVTVDSASYVAAPIRGPIAVSQADEALQ
jgi:hypothetical protein